MKPPLLVIGAGGHARVVISIARRTGDWDIVGVLDRAHPTVPESIDGVPIVGSFDDAARFFSEGVRQAALAVGDNDERAVLHTRFAALGFNFPTLCHPTSIVEANATLADGCIICAGAIIGTGVSIGCGAIVNTGAIIDHETMVGDYAHIAPGCRVAGRVRIGTGAMLGIGTCVRDKQVIGTRAMVGAGSVVVDDIPNAVIAYGNPTRVIRPRTP
jgi:sugar O-acyltransferase (sialic acid O-acetyltransferase NeuD family)